MTPNELYDLTPESRTFNLNELSLGSYGRLLPEIDELSFSYWFQDELKQTRIEIAIYKNVLFDGRRSWVLQSVWFDSSPVMIMRGAGRDCDDHTTRFVTDVVRYREMILYIKQLILEHTDPDDIADTVDPDIDIIDLASFYGHDLNTF